jgi:uncharacterized protein (TIGR02145 family)
MKHLLGLVCVFSAMYVVSCKEDPKPPVVLTEDVTEITATTAVSGGTIKDDGGDVIISSGVCWSTSGEPTIEDSKTSESGASPFVSDITQLLPGTSYNVRAYATNSGGTGYGNTITFKTYAVCDADGNGYHSVTIGTQTWLTENLRTTKYNDSTAIPSVNNNWGSLTTGACCTYLIRTDSDFIATFGRLYNWYAVGTGKLAPAGWHVATDDEWAQLSDYLGSDAGSKLKEAGSTHWTSPNLGATNETGFTALPGGYRSQGGGSFDGLGRVGIWWTATEVPAPEEIPVSVYAHYRDMRCYDIGVYSFGEYKGAGLSVRCVKD